MGRRGPAPKPTQLKLIEGAQTCRINFDEPIAPDELPVCPDDCSDEVREVWDECIAVLSAMRLARAADRHSLRCFCEAVVNHRKASAILARSPMLIKDPYDRLVPNPAFGVQTRAAHTVRQFAQEFGLTPSARSAITVGGKKTEDDNPFAESFGS